MLYTSTLSDEKLILFFSALQRTDVKTSVLKAEEELRANLSANALAMS